MAISKVILNNDVQIDITDTTASQSDVASTKYYYGADGVKKQGSYVVPSAVTQATPTISVNSSTGLITASATQSAGVVSAGTKSATEQLSTQAAQTLYPSTTDQTISSGKYVTGTQTFKGVLLTNLTAGNIKKDVVVKVGDSAADDRITSVTGTYSGLVYETGTWTPTMDMNNGSILFANTHSLPPSFYFVEDITTSLPSQYSTVSLLFVNYYYVFGYSFQGSVSDISTVRWGTACWRYIGSSTTTGSASDFHEYTGSTDSLYPDYWATATTLKPYAGGNARWFRSGRTYKWLAGWVQGG